MNTRASVERVTYEPTERLLAAHSAHVTARAHLEAGVGVRLCHSILFRKDNQTKSAARRRVTQWAVKEGYFRPVRPKPEAPAPAVPKAEQSIEQLLAAAEAKFRGQQ